MDFYGKHFIYANKSSRDYDLLVTSVSSSVFKSLNGTDKTQNFYGRKSWKNYHLGTSWDDSPPSFTLEVSRQTPLNQSELKEIEKWLFNRSSFAKFYIDQEDDYTSETTEIIDGQEKRLYLNCKMRNPSKLYYDGGIVGFSFTMECDSGFAHQDEITVEYAAGDGASSVDIQSDFDCPGYIYPRIVLQVGSTGGTVSIVNSVDDPARLTTFVGVSPNEQIVINSAVNYVSGDNYTKFVGCNFPRLIDGENTFVFSGDIASAAITWSNMRYL